MTQSASSAPPLAADDASALAPGTCQWETEQRRFSARVERDSVPVCNIWFDAEIGIGHQRVAVVGEPRSDSIVYQFKKVLVPAGESGWAFGVGAATVRAIGGNGDNGGGSRTRQNIVNALLSRQLGDTALHLNLGAVSNHEAESGTHKRRLSWAIAAEHNASDRWTLVGEVFGQRGLPETAQLGLRWWVVPKYAQLTASVGAQRGEGRGGRWVSFGVRLETGDPIF